MNEQVKEIKELVRELNRTIRKEREKGAESLIKSINEAQT